jgi:hypothetical protein
MTWRAAFRLVTPVVVALAAACQTPTEIVLALATDVPCDRVTGSAVTVATPDGLETAPVTTSSSRCDGGDLGTIVVVPGPSPDAEIGIRTALSTGARSVLECRAGSPDCIVATRALRFVKHTSLHISVSLDAACVGVACGPDQTCSAGLCAPIDRGTCGAGAGCEPPVTVTSRLDGAVDGNADTGADAPEGSVSAPTPDASSDAPAASGSCTQSAQCATGCCCAQVTGPAECENRRLCIADLNSACL